MGQHHPRSVLVKILNLKLIKPPDWTISLSKIQVVERHVNIKETQTAKSLECEILRGAYFFNEVNGKVGGEPLYAKRYFRVPSAKVINVFFSLERDGTWERLQSLRVYSGKQAQPHTWQHCSQQHKRGRKPRAPRHWLSQLWRSHTTEHCAAVKGMRARGNTVNDAIMMSGDRRRPHLSWWALHNVENCWITMLYTSN